MLRIYSTFRYYGSIWGEYTADEKKEYDERKSKLEASLALQTMREFGYRTFQITDWKAGGAWTTPLRRLRAQLLSRYVRPAVVTLSNSARTIIANKSLS